MRAIVPSFAVLVVLSAPATATAGSTSGPRFELECPDGGKVRGYRPWGLSVLAATIADRAECEGGTECCVVRDAEHRWVQHGPSVSFSLIDGTRQCETQWARGEQVGPMRCWGPDGSAYEVGDGSAPPRVAGPTPAPVDARPPPVAAAATVAVPVPRPPAVPAAPGWPPSAEALASARPSSMPSPSGPETVATTAAPPTESVAGMAAPPPVTLLLTDFSAANADAIRATKDALDERLAFLPDSSGVTTEVALVPGSEGSLVTVQERMAGPLEWLGFVPDINVAGHRAVNINRARLVARSVNAWVVVGPERSALAQGNAALAEALGKRYLLVQYVNERGMVLNLTFAPTFDGDVVFDAGIGLVVAKGGVPTQVVVDPHTGLLPLPVGADGRPTPAAEVYDFFGVAP